MDYTQSPDAVIHAGTGKKMHSLAGAVTTEVTDKDLNSLIWSLMAILNEAAVAGVQFDPAVPGSYDRVLVALRKLFLSCVAGQWIKDSSGKDLLFSTAGGASYLNGLLTTHLQVGGTTVLRANADGTATLTADAVDPSHVTRLSQVQALIALAGNTRPGHTYNLASDWMWINKAEGFFVQWGSAVASAASAVAVTYPTSFVSGRVAILFDPLFSGSTVVTASGELNGSATLSGFSFYNSNTSGAVTSIYLAFGK